MKPNQTTHPKTNPIPRGLVLIQQGAEAKIYLTKKATPHRAANHKSAEGAENTIDAKHQQIIIKDRIEKKYRHKQLDEQIRKSRTKHEAKILEKAKELGINVPSVIKQDKFNIQIEYLNGERLSETLNSKPEKTQFKIMQQIGEQVALLHKENIIHGDLTTSNIILIPAEQTQAKRGGGVHKASVASREAPADHNINERSSTNVPKAQVYIIDFGLGFISARLEDKACDLHLIKQALEAKHWQNHKDLFKNFLKTYKGLAKRVGGKASEASWANKSQDINKEAKKVLEQLKKVEARGRYKH